MVKNSTIADLESRVTALESRPPMPDRYRGLTLGAVFSVLLHEADRDPLMTAEEALADKGLPERVRLVAALLRRYPELADTLRVGQSESPAA